MFNPSLPSRYEIAASVIHSILVSDPATLPEEQRREVNDKVLEVIDRFANAGELVAYKKPLATERLDIYRGYRSHITYLLSSRRISKDNVYFGYPQ